MANDHQITIGHLSFTSPQSLSHSSMDGSRDLTLSGVIAHTNATGLDKVAEAVAKLAGAEDCGCNRRRKKLNKVIPYKKTT